MKVAFKGTIIAGDVNKMYTIEQRLCPRCGGWLYLEEEFLTCINCSRQFTRNLTPYPDMVAQIPWLKEDKLLVNRKRRLTARSLR